MVNKSGKYYDEKVTVVRTILALATNKQICYWQADFNTAVLSLEINLQEATVNIYKATLPACALHSRGQCRVGSQGK